MKAGGFLELGGAVASGGLKEEVERQYRRLYGEIPVDRFLCCPYKAMGFAAIVRDRLGASDLDLPDNAILETLINLRKRGAIKTEARET